tara:strand:+ start:51 stop:1136 length:1086 start_codon:yes stop_codon:yes gene_type:complete
MGADDASPAKAPLPHYALPNFSVVLPTYANHEADVITNAFRVGNFVSLSDMPSTIKPGQVSRSRFQKILDNRQESQPSAIPPYKAKQFSTFEYVPSPYSVADDLARDARIRSMAAMEAAGHTKPFHMSDTQIKLPHEDGFGGQFNPYKRDADPYERADDQALRFQWLQDALVLSTPFRPSGRVKGMTGQSANEIPGRQMLPEIVDRLRIAIEEDWEEYSFLVCSTDDEHLVLRFELSTLDSEPGLVAYMNIFARTNEVVFKYTLKKVVEDWNVTPGDGHLYFTFRPPWVQSRPLDTYYSLHPEQRTFQDPRLKASRAAAAAAAAATDNGASLSASESALLGSQFASATDLAAGAALRPDLT